MSDDFSDGALIKAVAAIYTAANVVAGDGEQKLYRAALRRAVRGGTTIGDEDLKEAAHHIVVTEKWDFGRKPSPALLMDAIRHVRGARAARTARGVQVAPIPSEQLVAKVSDIRNAHHYVPRSKA